MTDDHPNDDHPNDDHRAPVDLGPAGQTLTAVLDAITDDQLDRPTPCTEFTVAELLRHCLRSVTNLAAAADGQPTSPDLAGEQARDLLRHREIPRLVKAFQAPTATSPPDGRAASTRPGPGSLANYIAVEELTIHAWDLAVAIGQPVDPDRTCLDALLSFLIDTEDEDLRDGDGRPPFGSRVDIAASASVLEQILGLAGRDPGWRPPEAIAGWKDSVTDR